MTSPTQSGTIYWERRYASGGSSGPGSVDEVRAWKWGVVRQYVGDPEEVLDVACGDLSFWEGHDCASYVGIDVSPSVLAKDRERRPPWSFIAASAATRLNVRRKVVFCFDLLFHILDDDAYHAILDNLCEYTGEWLFLYTWQQNPFEKLPSRIRITAPIGESRMRRVGYVVAHPIRILKAILAPARNSDNIYQMYRPLEASFDRIRNAGLTLEATYPCPYGGAVGALYVFRRTEARGSPIASRSPSGST